MLRQGGGHRRRLLQQQSVVRSRAVRHRHPVRIRLPAASLALSSCATCATARLPGMSKLPVSGVTSPRTNASSVDLPLPFSPVMPIFSPRYRLKVAFSNSTRVPRRIEISEKLSIAGQNPPQRYCGFQCWSGRCSESPRILLIVACDCRDQQGKAVLAWSLGPPATTFLFSRKRPESVTHASGMNCYPMVGQLKPPAEVVLQQRVNSTA